MITFDSDTSMYSGSGLYFYYLPFTILLIVVKQQEAWGHILYFQ